MHVLFEGASAAVDAQARELGGEEAEPWAELRALQAALPGRRRWDGAAGAARPARAARRLRRGGRDERGARSPSAVVEAMCSPS